MSRLRAQRLTSAIGAIALALALLCALCPGAASAAPGAGAGGPVPAGADGVAALLRALPDEYRTADPSHEAIAAGRARTMAAALRTQVERWLGSPGGSGLATAAATAKRLESTLAVSRDRLRPWPLPLWVGALAGRLERRLRQAGFAGTAGARPYGEIESLLERAGALGQGADAEAYSAEAYALFAAGPAARLRTGNPALATTVSDAFWASGGGERGLLPALAEGRPASAVEAASETAQERVGTAAVALGDRSAGSATVVADAAVIVFREGLEAVLIVAAVTAAFVGERRRLRRPVLLGALLGLAASAVTYVLAQAIVAALGDGGLRLQAITGLLAIAVLLVVTNWFFHRLYWSEWIGRFHRRRRALERLDRRGFLSGQVAALVLLGLTSVYREGFETVLFLQNLQVSAGTHATLLGVGIGLAGTFAVGLVTFRLERKLPYKRMLIATGILIGLVLAVMVGTTVHTMQGLGWVPSTPTGFVLPLWCNRWLGAFPTWEGLGAQLAGLLVVFGSYALARRVQGGAARRRGSADASIQGEGALG
jgi:high-affinity iron transporter